MSEVNSNDGSREITQEERQQFVDAIEGLEEFWEPGIGEGKEIQEVLYGPECGWTDEIRAEIEEQQNQHGSNLSAFFRTPETSVMISKTTMGALLKEDPSEYALALGDVRWRATTHYVKQVGELRVSTEHNYEVGQSSNLPYVARYVEWQRFRQPDGAFVQKGRTEAEQAAYDKLEAARYPKADGWGQPREYWDAVGELLAAHEDIKRQREEMEAITGVRANSFTKERFETIMRHLGAVGAHNFEPSDLL